MTEAVVEVGPQSVQGPDAAPPEWVSTALDCIDDEFAVLGDRLVEVADLWREVLDAAAAQRVDTLVLVVPTWWSPARVERITGFGRRPATETVVRQRAAALAENDDTVLELSEEFAVLARRGVEPLILVRDESDIEAHLAQSQSVLIDVPAGVTPLAPESCIRLRTLGIGVTHSDRGRMVRTVAGAPPAPHRGDGPGARRRAAAVLVGAVLAVSALGAIAVTGSEQEAPDPTALLVEGRIAVRIPALWPVQRNTAGPGSSRLTVSAPDGISALHVTQSVAAAPTTIAETAELLGRAMRSEAPGVFTDFDPHGAVGGRAAVTYRERRAGSETTWAVVVDGSLRIAIGCQSPPQRHDAVEQACVIAVQSAHEVR